MLSVKLPYHPEIESLGHVTRFGVLEITTPTVYETPIANKTILRIDTLEALREDWGDNALIARNTTYSIVSGNCDDDILNKRLASYYRKYEKVTEWVNNLYEVGTSTEPLAVQVTERVKGIISAYQDYVKELMSNCGGKYLVSTHCYMYYSFNNGLTIPELKGTKVIV